MGSGMADPLPRDGAINGPDASRVLDWRVPQGRKVGDVKRRLHVPVVTVSACSALEQLPVWLVATTAMSAGLACISRADTHNGHAAQGRFIANERFQLSERPLAFFGETLDLGTVPSHTAQVFQGDVAAM